MQINSYQFNPRYPSLEVCEELNIPTCENELSDFPPPWTSHALGILMPKDSAEKKIQEYLIEKLNNLENEQFGFFYKIKDSSKKTRGYLCGTIHDIALLDEHLNFNLHKKVYKNLSKVQHVAFENDPVTWRQALKNHSLSSMAIEAESSPMLDLKLSVLAHQQNKAVYDLEPLHLIPPSTQQKKIKPNLSLFHDAFYESSETKLEEFLKEVDTKEDTEKLNDRNEKMAEKIIELLRSCGNERIFIAVGAAHMVGKNGIPNLLSQKTYTIKQIKPIFTKSINKDFFQLSEDTLIFLTRSISRTENQEYAPIHKDMALCNIVQTLLRKGSKNIIHKSVLLIAEKINPGPHRECAFSEIAKYQAQQGNIEEALAAAFKMKEHMTNRSDTFEYIANTLVDQGDVNQAMHIMEKYSNSFHYYPGQVALKLAKQGAFKKAIDMAASIELNRYPKHRDAAFAAVSVIMARKGMTKLALHLAENYIHPELRDITKASISKIDGPGVVDRASSSFLYSNPSEQLYKSLSEFGLASAFN